MSTASPVINVEIDRAQAEVRATLLRLSFRRRLLQAIAKGSTVVACALASLFVIAIVDYKWPLTRPIRIALFSLILISALSFLTKALWLLLRRRTLVDAARAIERATGSRGNALVTLAETFEGMGQPETQPYILARLERQARSELASM